MDEAPRRKGSAFVESGRLPKTLDLTEHEFQTESTRSEPFWNTLQKAFTQFQEAALSEKARLSASGFMLKGPDPQLAEESTHDTVPGRREIICVIMTSKKSSVSRWGPLPVRSHMNRPIRKHKGATFMSRNGGLIRKQKTGATFISRNRDRPNTGTLIH